MATAVSSPPPVALSMPTFPSTSTTTTTANTPQSSQSQSQFKRRRFISATCSRQSPLSSFYTSSNANITTILSDENSHYPSSPPPFSQASSHEIQSQLLHVGMRVRKSIADGYKHQQKATFTPRPFFNVSGNLSLGTREALSATAAGMGGVCTSSATDASIVTGTGDRGSLWRYSMSSKRRYSDDDDVDRDERDENYNSIAMDRDVVLVDADGDVNIDVDIETVDDSPVSIPLQPLINDRRRKIARPRGHAGAGKKIDSFFSRETGLSSSPFTSSSSSPCRWSETDRGSSPSSSFTSSPPSCPETSSESLLQPLSQTLLPTPLSIWASTSLSRSNSHSIQPIMSILPKQSADDFEDAWFLQRKEDVDGVVMDID